MKQRVKQLLITIAIIAAPLVGIAAPQVAMAAPSPAAGSAGGTGSGGTTGTGVNVFSNCGNTGTSGTQICGAANDPDGFTKLIKNIVNILLVALGMIAVIMIIIGGVRYTTSNGDSSQVKSAKDTIMYAVIGLVVAIMAYAIVNFVLGFFK